MLQLVTAQDEKLLCQRLCKDIEHKSMAPLAMQWLVIGNHASKTWLQQQLATELELCAGFTFLQPGSLIWQTLTLAGVEIPATPQFDARVLRWRVADCLHPADQPMDLSALAEAEEYARVIDRYLHYRPEQMKQWAQHPPANDPVAAVWQQVVQRFGEQHPQRLLEKIRPGSEHETQLKCQLPPAIRVFNPQQLSTVQFNTLQLLSRFRPVTVYIKNPSPEEFWFDIKDMWQQLYEKLENPVLYEYYDKDGLSPLLEQLGRQKAGLLNEFLRLEDQLDGFEHINLTDEGASGNGAKAESTQHLLASVRADLAEGRSTPTPHPVDDSIRIHACHTRRRELEVARDDILDAIQNGGLEPADILVLAPDINEYSQWIEPVFNQSPLAEADIDKRAGPETETHHKDEKRPHLPWHIDRMRVQDAPAARALLALLQSLDGRLGAAEVMDLLLHEPIRDQFDLGESDLAILENWVRCSKIRWGQDAAHRQELGFYPDAINTWAFGSDRWAAGLLLGESDLSLDVLETHADLEGNEALFAAFFDFLDGLSQAHHHWQARKKTPLTASEWFHWLKNLMQEFLADSDSRGFEQAMEQLHKVLVDDTRHTQPRLTSEALMRLTEEALSERAYRSAGEIGVRFQSWENACLGPARMVFVLGMNANEFPGREPFSDLDKTRTQPQPLDKNRRLRDKNLFLDLLSERLDRLAFSYQGFSASDNAELAPSAVLETLLDYLKVKTGDQFRITEHRMHGFHPEYFGVRPEGSKKPPLFSYQQQALEQAHQFIRPKSTPPEAEKPNLHLETELSMVSLNRLQGFFSDPLKDFLRDSLPVRLDMADEQLPEEENWQLTPLDKHHAESLVSDHMLTDPLDIKQLLHLDGLLPASPMGDLEATDFANHAAESLADRSSYGLTLTDFHWTAPDDWTGDVREIAGEVSVTPGGQLMSVVMGDDKQWSKSKPRPKDVLRHWLAHVFYAPNRASWLMAPAQCLTFLPLENPDHIQKDLLDLFESGCHSPCFVLPLGLFGLKSGNVGDVLNRFDDKGYFKGIRQEADKAYNRHLALFLAHFLSQDKAVLASWRERVLEPMTRHMQIASRPDPDRLQTPEASSPDVEDTCVPPGGQQ